MRSNQRPSSLKLAIFMSIGCITYLYKVSLSIFPDSQENSRRLSTALRVRGTPAHPSICQLRGFSFPRNDCTPDAGLTELN